MKRDAEEAFGTVPDEEPKLTEEDPGARGTESGETIEIKVQFGKISKVVTRRADSTVADLKQEIEKQTGGPGGDVNLDRIKPLSMYAVGQLWSLRARFKHRHIAVVACRRALC